MKSVFSKYPYIKQSKQWEAFLESLGWKCTRTGSGVLVSTRKLWIFGLAKIQKPKALSEKDLKEIFKICRKNGVHLLFLEPGLDQDTKLLKRYGFRERKTIISETSSMFIDVRKSEEELWKALSRSGRYGVNRAKREGSEVKFYSDPDNELLELHCYICRQTGRRNKFVTQSLKEIKGKSKMFNKNAHLAVVYNQKGEPLGSKIYFCANGLAFYDSGGTTRLGKGTRAGFDLMWESILYIKRQGYEIFDLGGAYDERYHADTKSWKGFTEFKAKFGPEILVFPMTCSKFGIPRRFV